MDPWLSGPQQYPSLCVAASSLGFRLVHRLLQNLPHPKVLDHDSFGLWKWRNLSVSLVHSLITGTWAVTCVVLWPETLYEIYSYVNPQSYLLVCISTGKPERTATKVTLEMLKNFLQVIWCFLYALFTWRYLAGTAVALLVEVNSVFLHARLLLKLAGVQSSQLYTANRLLNLLTYISFRLGAQAYLTWYILHNYSWLDLAGCFLATMVLMDIMILVYFYRLLLADFIPCRRARFNHNGNQDKSTKFLKD